ncbi:GNAT family N-acetyltransferase [Aureimonas leprariae]|uniref:GNAT family N-acetyltransferase n=1 Tax=Plantimonas leprariae TaxID=2615207 RepID=A0A7V7PTA3_9HYPH|nr:GNAT family N-acetyltransferase [Aureimonas leprariae]KAB0682848.1 GNAT family N-acetyltransferase [Aureimonas leprariae]
MFRISDYRNCRHYGPLIAERVWTAWWQDSGVALVDFTRHVDEMADDRPIPAAFVAHDQDGYAGSAFLIESDLDERPECRPWIAALWVEEGKRGRGIATALLRAAAAGAAELGHETVHLCCRRHLESFYETRGWRVEERGVGPHDLSVLIHRRKDA